MTVACACGYAHTHTHAHTHSHTLTDTHSHTHAHTHTISLPLPLHRTAILRRFVAPVAETQWVGYKLSGRETLDFVVKYEPNGQPFLRKHHDASTFSLNVALNRIGVDFEGGGTRFTRQNCTVLDNKVGHALIHPGRLTHQHEGLYVTKGTRYIIVSFVDQV